MDSETILLLKLVKMLHLRYSGQIGQKNVIGSGIMIVVKYETPISFIYLKFYLYTYTEK